MLGLTADTIPLFVCTTATVSVPYKEPGSGWCFVPGIPQLFVAKVTRVSVLEISHILTAHEAAPRTALKQQLVNFPSVEVTLLGLVTGGIH